MFETSNQIQSNEHGGTCICTHHPTWYVSGSHIYLYIQYIYLFIYIYCIYIYIYILIFYIYIYIETIYNGSTHYIYIWAITSITTYYMNRSIGLLGYFE